MPEAAQPQGTAKVVIGRLSIKLSGLSESDARRLAQLVAAELGNLPHSPGMPVNIDSLKISMPATKVEDTGKLASKIAAQIVGELKRNS